MFDQEDFSLLEPVVVAGQLQLKSTKSGRTREARPEETLLFTSASPESYEEACYEYVMPYTAENPICSRQLFPEGCEKCGRKVIAYRRVQKGGKACFQCMCGHTFYIN